MKIIDTSTLTPDTHLTRNEKEWVYNGLDVCVTLEVLNELLPQLDGVSSATYAFSRALQAPILEMSMRGVRVDQHKKNEVLGTIQSHIERISDQLTRLLKEGIGTELNWRSPPQLKTLFYEVMGLKPIRKRNANGQFVPTVNREAIEQLSQYYHAEPICIHLLALRDLDKKRQFLQTEIDTDGRIRTNFNIAGTTTGRLASSFSDFGTGTNLQNVDRELRSVFIPDPGYKFCNLDLEQGDSRNVGATCWNHFIDSHGEAFAGSYLNACESSDLHVAVCRMAWKTLPWRGDSVEDRRVAEAIAYRQDSYRQLAKKLGHGTNFYGRPPTMAKHTKVAVSLIDEFQQEYFRSFPCIGVYNKDDHITDCWHNRVRNALRSTHSLTTLLGRRRFFYGRPNDDSTIREAIAYEPQSLTADEIDTALLKLWRAQKVQLLIQVHDSILFQFPEELENEIVPWARDLAKVVIQLKKGRDFYVPVEAKTGWNWGDESKDNPDGLLKWKGVDSRQRTERPALSILNVA